MTETGCYLYAISRGVTAAELADTPGLGGAVLRVVEHRGLSAVVSVVDLDDFGEVGLRRNLEDLGWLEVVARTHDAVVHSAAARGPTAPLRLATICLDDAGVRARLDEWYDALQRTLDRVEGRMEWSVKAYSSAGSPSSQPQAPSTSGGGSGAAYLQRKRSETLDRQNTAEAAQALAEDLHAALSQRSVASRRLQAQDPRLTGHRGTMTLNGAYLVEATEAAEFEAAAKGLADAHPDSRLEVQGPWPPYSFATLEDT